MCAIGHSRCKVTDHRHLGEQGTGDVDPVSGFMRATTIELVAIEAQRKARADRVGEVQTRLWRDHRRRFSPFVR